MKLSDWLSTNGVPGNARPRRTRTGKRSIAGSAALEMALILPFFVVLILGLVDFGHMLFVVNTITNAAREGARRGVVQQNLSNVASAAETAADGYLSAAGITGATSSAAMSGNDLVVTVSIPEYKNISGFDYNLPGLSASNLGEKRTLSSISTMRWEFASP